MKPTAQRAGPAERMTHLPAERVTDEANALEPFDLVEQPRETIVAGRQRLLTSVLMTHALIKEFAVAEEPTHHRSEKAVVALVLRIVDEVVEDAGAVLEQLLAAILQRLAIGEQLLLPTSH